MRLKDFFAVPAGKKVTEKDLHRVLVSSICSILLCMACLVSTTWAWFAVSLENTGNIIAIATVDASIVVTQGENSVDPQDSLTVFYFTVSLRGSISLGWVLCTASYCCTIIIYDCFCAENSFADPLWNLDILLRWFYNQFQRITREWLLWLLRIKETVTNDANRNTPVDDPEFHAGGCHGSA